MIEIKNVSKYFTGDDGPFKAVDNVSLTIEDNEIFGVIGESGAGKSTLLRFINALEIPEEGQVIVNGTDIQSLTNRALRAHQKDIGIIFQQFNLLSNKTVEENILLPLTLHHYSESVPIDQILDFVGLTDRRNHYPAQLSGGQKQRVGIARALITRPKILLCDEPTSALDENTTSDIVSLLKEAHKTFGMTVVIVTHELDVIKSLCLKAAIIEDGKLIDIISVDRNDEVPEVKTYHQRALEVLTND